MKIRTMIITLILGMALSSCKTKAEIEIVEVLPVAKIADEYRHVEFYEPIDEEHYENLNTDGLTAVKFTASKDLESILVKKEMHHLYYTLTNCDIADDEVLSGRVFKKTKMNSLFIMYSYQMIYGQPS
jgi:hypothetical protein